MSRHTFMALYEDCTSSGRRYRVRTYLQAADEDSARAMLASVKILKIKNLVNKK
jgi:hypothetical protein